MRRIFTQGVICLLALVLSLSTQAQEIANWTFNNTVGAVCGENVGGSTASFSPFIATTAYNGGAEFYGQGAWPSGGINTDAYLQFTLSPNSGFLLNLLAIEIRMRRSNTGSPSGSGPTQFTVRSSLDNYTGNLAWGFISHNYQNISFLPGILFGMLPTPVTFRVYGHNASTNSGGQSRLVFDHIRVLGMGNILPVRLTSFEARKSSAHVSIQFKLDNTQVGDKYLIERSSDGRTWESLHQITESRAANNISHGYSDMQAPNVAQLYYRIRIKEVNGKESLSSTATILQKTTAFTARYHGGMLMINTHPRERSEMQVTSAGGQVIWRKELLPGSQSLSIPLSTISYGIYYVTIKDQDGAKSIPILVN